ncbi:PilZ domain-containing protein [Nitrospira sp. BLG_2]|uniref:PilZ domain-containing protein n=1 Tax=Nitrospira sp. BLG_2 TaxID=3397507 RepID=UPI003B9CA80F
MPQSEPATILLVNAIAEEIKQVTLTFRKFLPNCRVEAVYTPEEALQWAQLAPWRLILINEQLIEQHPTPLLSELKRLAPSATLVLQTDRSSPTIALDSLQTGADFLLDKKSPAFFTELVLYAKDAFEKQDDRIMFEQLQDRHGRLIETLTDVLYELDSEGRFAYLSPSVVKMLGYSPEELVGAPYSTVIAPDQLDRARHRFDDRRTGERASRSVEIELVPKALPHRLEVSRIKAEISAHGLYNSQRRHLGTFGLLRDVSTRRNQEETIHRLERQLQQTDQLIATAQQLVRLSKNLEAPQATILAQSQQLLNTIRDVRLIERVETLALYAEEAARLGETLSRAAVESAASRDTINEVIESVLTATEPSFIDRDRIERAYALDLPPFTEHRESAKRLLRILLSQALHLTTVTLRRRRLKISTAAIDVIGKTLAPGTTLAPPIHLTEVEVRIEETDATVAGERPSPPETGDLFEAYALIKQLGGRLDFIAPANGRLSITIRIPTKPTPKTTPLTEAGPSIQRPAPVLAMAAPIPPGPTPPLPDRRKRMRTTVDLRARVTIGNTPYEGVVTDLSPSGASLEIEGALPAFEQQPVYLLIKATVSTLELDATAHDREETPRRAGMERRRTSRLALEFTALGETQQEILASFIEAARIRAFAITVEAQFPMLDRTVDFVAGSTETGLRGADHRETLRVRLTLPVRIETSAIGSLIGIAVNFSRGGVCLQTEPFLTMTDEVVVLHFSSIDVHDQSEAQNPEATEAILTGRIVHLAPHPTVSSELTPRPSQTGQRIGIRFSQLTPLAEREVNRVLALHLGSPSIDFADRDGRPLIMSDRWECRNTHGRIIAVTADHARHDVSQDIPIIIVIPGFGSTQTDYVPLSFYLAANHLRVLRYDHSNHVGQSEGNILQFTLRNMETDLQSVLDFAHTTWPTAPIAFLAEDIAARVAAKVIARSTSADQLFLLNPALDLETSLSPLDLSRAIETYRQGHRLGVVNIWGFNINFDKFIGDAITGDYVDSASPRSDFAQLATPPVILVSPRKNRPIEHPFDPHYQSLRALGIAPTVVSLQADVSGESVVNDERRIAAFKTILKLLSTSLIGNPPSAPVREPRTRDVYQQQQLEHERTRIRHHVSQATRNALWGAHLAQLYQLEHLPDYLAFTNELYRLLLPLEPNMTILDIGCGHTNFIRLMLTNLAYRWAHQSGLTDVPLRYIGLDHSHESLRLAEQQTHTFAEELPGTLTAAVPIGQLLTTSWMHTDWNASLPFIDGSIGRILCHLSLSFTPSPLHCLRQMLRVLHPDGTAILTSLQPHTDLSRLFRRHPRAADHDKFGSPAKIVLHYFGRLREAVRHGLLHNYERDELARLLTHAGAGSIQFYSVLDDQLLLAVVRKTKSAG